MIILLLTFAYLLGSIPSALIVGKIARGIDIREHGSGNLGATNVGRILGKKAGLIVTILDVTKGAAAVLLPVLFQTDAINPLFLGIAAVIGHMYPVFAGFRGGKAVATSAGIILAYAPLAFLILAIAFFSTLKITKYVSLSVIISVTIGVIYSIIDTLWISGNWHLLVLLTILEIFILYRHRTNITRIKEGTEPKVSWL